MDEKVIINQAVDRYNKLFGILRNATLKDEDASFLQGRMLELLLLIYTLDEQAISRITERLADTKAENIEVNTNLLRVFLN
jgi:hypothetical protein